jgi:predicted SAM-dependent methyltransferase
MSIRRHLKKIALVRHLARHCARLVGALRLRMLAARRGRKRIVIGASGQYDRGWIPTDQDFFDMLKPSDWARYFQLASINAMLAEHVWEHITEEEGRIAAKMCFEYLAPGGYLRVAVPDGLHPSPDYIKAVRVGGSGEGAYDHKVLYTYRTLKDVFEAAGFEVTLYEFFDEAGRFHYEEWRPEDGKIWRSRRYDERNQGGRLDYTSLVLDAVKKKAP